LQALLLDLADLEPFVAEVAAVASSVVGGTTECGITLRRDGGPVTVAASGPRAAALDETQYWASQGPCLQTLRTGEVVELVDARTDRRWPGYLPDAVEAGLRCSLSLPLARGGETFGALNVYGFDAPHTFGPQERRRMELFAAQAAGALRLATRRAHDTVLLAQMEEALGSRTTIDQAMGIIMGRQRCTAAVAFDLLRRESQHSHRRLSEVAADLVRRTTGEDPSPARRFDVG
jgi:GAF domain-containing protein